MSNTCLSCTKKNYCDNAFTDIEDCQVFTSEPIKIPKPKPIVFFSDTEILTRGEILNQREMVGKSPLTAILVWFPFLSLVFIKNEADFFQLY